MVQREIWHYSKVAVLTSLLPITIISNIAQADTALNSSAGGYKIVVKLGDSIGNIDFGNTFIKVPNPCKTKQISQAYTRAGAGENLVAPFTSPSTSTTKSYSGLVEIVVSGTGYSYGTTVNDVFFGVKTGKVLDPQYYQLNLGWNGAPLEAYLGEPRNIANFIKFVDGMGLAALPAYNNKHSYHFVMEVPKNAGRLSFGVADGDFADNGGQYNIKVYPVKSNLPASCI
ncbi:hypothetical protein [Candidatus Marithrix sp. Canyon 246]|uniref:hypothetical protein n=1 Tax=Candidatus Marithrix sp. Canyon 246 TaxID=1827136 RepID=UPI00084A2864|nr:hypothetical protein [Candidatus Marithrix sp. Canyon 246]